MLSRCPYASHYVITITRSTEAGGQRTDRSSLGTTHAGVFWQLLYVFVCRRIRSTILYVWYRTACSTEQEEPDMDVGYRLRQIRELRNLSQGDIEKRTGLLRCYVSRVENGHTVPSIETLEKMSRALEISMYQLFLDLEPASAPDLSNVNGHRDWASQGKGHILFQRIRRVVSGLSERDRKFILHVAGQMGKKQNSIASR